MECNYWLNSLPQACRSRASSLLSFSTILLLGTLFGCASNSVSITPVEHEDTARVPILINLVVETHEADKEYDPDSIKNVQVLVLNRLRTIMSPEDFHAIRSYRMLPLLALSADAETLLYLLRMPQIRSIKLDREMGLFE